MYNLGEETLIYYLATELKSTKGLVMLYILAHTDTSKGNFAEAGIRDMSDSLRMSKETVMKKLRELENEGWITRDKSSMAPRKKTRYYINEDKIDKFKKKYE